MCVKDELCVLGKLVFHGTRIVVPKALWGLMSLWGLKSYVLPTRDIWAL